jgi:methyl-accepting chemotaxis protein
MPVQFFRDLSVRTRLFAGFGLVLVLSAVLGVVLIGELGSVNAGAVKLGSEVVPQTRTVGDIDATMNKYRKDQLHFILALPGDRPGVDQDLAGDTSTMQSLLSQYRNEAAAATDQALLDKFESDWTQYVSDSAAFHSLALQGKLQAAGNVVGQPPADDVWNSLKDDISKWQDQQTSTAHRSVRSSNSTYSSARTLAVALLALAIVVGLLIAFVVSGVIKRGTDQILNAAEAIAEGDVDQELTATSNDEIGRITAAFTRMIDYLRKAAGVAEGLAQGDLTVEPAVRSERDLLGNALRKVVVDLRATITQLSGSAAEVSAASQQVALTSEESGKATGDIADTVSEIARGAERQVLAVEQARRSAEEVGQALSNAAATAQETAEMANQAREVARHGVGAAEQASDAMRSVRDSSHEVSKAIRDLATKSGQIGAIVETITGIAEQTNLLALNAAIEAARAGEQGRGFAVVAEEVRKLAEEAQRSAHEISDLIGAIQNETTNTVDVVENGAKRTLDGAAVVEQTREAFLQIGTSVEDMTSRIEQIAAVSEEIAASAQSMQESIGEAAAVAEQSSASTEEVSASTQETSASAQEIAASARQLSGNAETLNRLVEQFRLNA